MTQEEYLKSRSLLVARPFPYRDCRALHEMGASDQLIPDLDIFFSDLAGFASSPEMITTRPAEQIERYARVLRESFFARFPEHGAIAKYITQQATPQLFEQLSAAESIRSVVHGMLLAAKKTS